MFDGRRVNSYSSLLLNYRAVCVLCTTSPMTVHGGADSGRLLRRPAQEHAAQQRPALEARQELHLPGRGGRRCVCGAEPQGPPTNEGAWWAACDDDCTGGAHGCGVDAFDIVAVAVSVLHPCSSCPRGCVGNQDMFELLTG